MRGTNVGDDRDIRLCRRRHARQLAEVVHAHFSHHDLGIPRHAKQRQRQADLVIEVPLGLLCAQALRQHSVQQLLGRRFANRTGHADHFTTAHLPVTARKVEQRL